VALVDAVVDKRSTRKVAQAYLDFLSRLEEFDYTGAAAIAAVMLAVSFLTLLAINALQAFGRRRSAMREEALSERCQRIARYAGS
jgi:ABC-type sulfate transport system substrate-binding protein